MPRIRYHIDQSPLNNTGSLAERVAELERKHQEALDKLNVTLLRISTRFDDLEAVGTQKPPTPRNFAVDGRQGAFHPRWEKVIGVSGYVITIGTNSNGTGITHRIPIHDPEAQTWPIAWGNVASTRYFIIYSVASGVVSDPSNVVSSTSVSFGAGESAPTAPSLSSDPPSATGPVFDRTGVEQQVVTF